MNLSLREAEHKLNENVETKKTSKTAFELGGSSSSTASPSDIEESFGSFPTFSLEAPTPDGKAFNPLETPQGLRFLFLLLSFPVFHDDENYDTLGRAFRAFRGLSVSQRQVLATWLALGTLQTEENVSSNSPNTTSAYPIALFEKQVQGLHQFVSIKFCEALLTDIPDPENLDQAPQHLWDFFCTRTSALCKNALACGDVFFRANALLQKRLRRWRTEERVRGTAGIIWV